MANEKLRLTVNDDGIHVSSLSSKGGYLYLFSINADGKIHLLDGVRREDTNFNTITHVDGVSTINLL